MRFKSKGPLFGMLLPLLFPFALSAQQFAYVTNLNPDSVSVIDTSSNTVVATVAVEFVPLGVAITPDGTRAYVTTEGSNSVSVIDTSSNTVVARVAVGIEPQGVIITPDGTH